MKKNVAVITTSRADYGLLRPVIGCLNASRTLRPHLAVTGMHLLPEHGDSLVEIRRDDLCETELVPTMVAGDSSESAALSMGLAVVRFASYFARHRPDWTLVLGDRYEMGAVALALQPFPLALAHIHGGELTEGAMDDSIRHAVTKLSHLHFASCAAYRDRIVQLGEEPWRVTVSGAPGLDSVRTLELWSAEDLSRALDLALTPPPILVTLHPETRCSLGPRAQIETVLGALGRMRMPTVFTAPNADVGGSVILAAVREYVSSHPEARLAMHLGQRGYFALMRHAAFMLGNSSSGMIEAASLGLPVVDIGGRQRGRVHGGNVIHAPFESDRIEGACRQALAPGFRARAAATANPYGDGHAAERITEVLERTPIDERLLRKRFHDTVPASPAGGGA